MTSPYIKFPDIYGANQGTMNPYQQNISSQNQSIQRLLQQGNQLANANLDGQTDTSFNGKQMANALRNLGQTANAYAPWTQSNIASNYGTDPYSEQSRMLAMQERGM